jgi:hypothetical protein
MMGVSMPIQLKRDVDLAMRRTNHSPKKDSHHE